MAREVKGQVGCSLKACVAAILSIVTIIIVVIVVVNLLNTGAENENENVLTTLFRSVCVLCVCRPFDLLYSKHEGTLKLSYKLSPDTCSCWHSSTKVRVAL